VLPLLLHTMTRTIKQTPPPTRTHPDMNKCTHYQVTVLPSPAPPAPAPPAPSQTWRSSLVSTERSTSTLCPPSPSPPSPPSPPPLPLPPPSLTWRSSSLSTKPEPFVSIESNNSRTLAEIFAYHKSQRTRTHAHVSKHTHVTCECTCHVSMSHANAHTHMSMYIHACQYTHIAERRYAQTVIRACTGDVLT
jgi:hypothetical protein